MLVVRIILGLLSAGCLLALITYALMLLRGNSDTLYATWNSELVTWQQGIFLSLAAIGLLVCTYNGVYGLLWWLPNSWGTYDEDGEFQSIRAAMSAVGTLFIGICFITALDSVTRLKFMLKVQQIYSDGISEIVENATSTEGLERLKSKYEGQIKKLNEEKKRHKSIKFSLQGLTQEGREISTLVRLLATIEGLRRRQQRAENA